MRLLAVAALALALAGCFDPFVAHVDPAAVSEASLPWVRHDLGSLGEAFGAKTSEVDYTHDPEGSGPPYPGTLQVFSLREPARRTQEELLQVLRDAVAAAADGNGIRLDDASQSGERTLRNGLATRYFTREGTVARGGLFAQDTHVRIVGEVGYDGSSSTTVIGVGIAQTKVVTTCPIVGACATQEDLRAWHDLVSDPSGSIEGQSGQHGLLWNLVTHG